MPPRRQTAQASTPRILTVRDLDHFESLVGGPQLCLAIYTDVSAAAPRRSRPAGGLVLTRLAPQTTRPQLNIISRALAELSAQPPFQHVTFAVVDISVEANAVCARTKSGLPAAAAATPNPAALHRAAHSSGHTLEQLSVGGVQDILDAQQITELPKLQAWRSGDLLMVRWPCSSQENRVLQGTQPSRSACAGALEQPVLWLLCRRARGSRTSSWRPSKSTQVRRLPPQPQMCAAAQCARLCGELLRCLVCVAGQAGQRGKLADAAADPLHTGPPPPPQKQGRRWLRIVAGVGLVAAAAALAALSQQRRGATRVQLGWVVPGPRRLQLDNSREDSQGEQETAGP